MIASLDIARARIRALEEEAERARMRQAFPQHRKLRVFRRRSH